MALAFGRIGCAASVSGVGSVRLLLMSPRCHCTAVAKSQNHGIQSYPHWYRRIAVFNINFQYPINVHDSRFRSCKRKECEACQNHGRHEKRWGSWKSDSRNGEAWEIEFITRRVRPTVVRASANAASLLLYCSLTRPLAHSPVFPITPVPHLGSGPFWANLSPILGVFQVLRAVFQKWKSSRPW